MNIFKFFFFLLLLLNIEGVFIPCAGSGSANAYNVLSTLGNAASPYAMLPADVFMQSVKMFKGDKNCFDELVDELQKTFVTKRDFDMMKQQMGKVLMNRAEAEIKTDRQSLGFVWHYLEENKFKVFNDQFKIYITTLGRETPLLMKDAKDFIDPSLKAATLTTAAMWTQELAALSATWAVLLVKCYNNNECSKLDMTTYYQELNRVEQIIWKCRDYYWQIERQLYEYREDPKLLKWNGEIKNFRTVHTGECNMPSPPMKARRYKRKGGSCAYVDSGYQIHGNFHDIDRKWETKTKTWYPCGCGISRTCGSDSKDGSQLCDKEDGGYPRNKMAKWLADEQRIKMHRQFDSYFKFNGEPIQKIVQKAKVEIFARSSDHQNFMEHLHELRKNLSRNPFGRRSLSDCNVDDFTQDELDRMSEEMGIMSFPICTPEPPLPMDHIYQEILESIGEDIEIIDLDEFDENIEVDNLNSFDEDVKTEDFEESAENDKVEDHKNKKSVDNAEESSDNESDRRLLRLFRL